VRLAGSPEPKTVLWSEALAMFATAGLKSPERDLIRAIISNRVGYYPRRALDLERFFRNGLLDPETGVLRMHAGDSGTFIRPILTDIKQYLYSEKTEASSEDRKTATTPPSTPEALRPAPDLAAGATKVVVPSPSNKPRGRRPKKLEATKDAMRADIRGRRLTVDRLAKMLEKEMRDIYKVSRTTCRDARKAILAESEFVGN
jgi:hypothetical protein